MIVTSAGTLSSSYVFTNLKFDNVNPFGIADGKTVTLNSCEFQRGIYVGVNGNGNLVLSGHNRLRRIAYQNSVSDSVALENNTTIDFTDSGATDYLVYTHNLTVGTNCFVVLQGGASTVSLAAGTYTNAKISLSGALTEE